MNKIAKQVGRKATRLSFTTKSKNQKQDNNFRIGSQEAYELTMNEIDTLMRKGEANLSEAEKKRLGALADAAERFEDTTHPLPLPASLPDMIRLKLLQLRIRQNYAAKLLGVSEAKFSLIMNGKQKPDLYFVKAVHDKLKVDANLILKAIA
jgi:HTH-type transcriptional regulator/antitoxin HigA